MSVTAFEVLGDELLEGIDLSIPEAPETAEFSIDTPHDSSEAEAVEQEARLADTDADAVLEDMANLQEVGADEESNAVALNALDAEGNSAIDDVVHDVDSAYTGEADAEAAVESAVAENAHHDVAFTMELIGAEAAAHDAAREEEALEEAELLGQDAGPPAYMSLMPPSINVSRDLGALAAQSQAFRDYVAKRIATGRPMAHHAKGVTVRDWQMDFGPVSGPAGQSTTIRIFPQCFFRGEKVMATDTGSPAGTGTRITQILVGQQVQRPAGGSGGSTLTSFFANTALANGLEWDTCDEALSIAVTVSFVQACTFDMSVFGQAAF